MDPLTAIGLVSNILSFIDFGVQVVRGAREIYVSPSGLKDDNRSTEAIAREMKRFSAKLIPPDDEAAFSGEAKQLCILARECEDLSQQLLELLEKVKPRSQSKFHSLLAAGKHQYYEKKKSELGRRLDECRNQLELQLGFLTR